MSPRLIKKEKGIALLLTIVVLIALSTMSIALLSIIQTSAKNTARSHRSMVANQAAEYGIEAARVDLIEDLVKTKRMPYIDAILYICHEKEIEPERIVRFIDKGMKEKLQVEAEATNALKGPKCNKLPL